MPRKGIIKLGNPRFDEKHPSIEESLPLDLNFPTPFPDYDKEVKELNSKSKFEARYLVLIELMEHFNIDPKEEDAWFQLTFKLAEHYVPGMQFEKKQGRPKKWTLISKLHFHALVQLLVFNNPNETRKLIFNRLPEEASKTSLRDIISLNAKPDTLEKDYDRYCEEQELDNLIEIIKKECSTETERVTFYKKLLYRNRT